MNDSKVFPLGQVTILTGRGFVDVLADMVPITEYIVGHQLWTHRPSALDA